MMRTVSLVFCVGRQALPDKSFLLDKISSQHYPVYRLQQLMSYYRIRKKFRGVFNFVFFADDKDPRNFFHK